MPKLPDLPVGEPPGDALNRARAVVRAALRSLLENDTTFKRIECEFPQPVSLDDLDGLAPNALSMQRTCSQEPTTWRHQNVYVARPIGEKPRHGEAARQGRRRVTRPKAKYVFRVMGPPVSPAAS
jgi:hypothetical protein